MNDDERGDELPISEADTTPPNPADAAVPSPDPGWQMPAPKFQQSSGYLPQGYLENLGFEAPPQADGSGAAAAPATEPPAPAVDVEPQPDLTEQLPEEPVATAPTPAAKVRSTGGRIVMIVLGLLAMAAFIAVFLVVVYYLFLAPPNGGSTF